MEDNRFLLTYYDGDSYTFSWYENEEEMRKDIANNPDWEHLEATEILQCRNIELSVGEKCISCGSNINENNLKVCNKCANEYRF